MADEFGELLKGLRQKLGDEWTQQKLAEAAGVPVASVRNWEQGHRRPDLGFAYRLARALGVSLDVLGEVADRNPLRPGTPPPTSGAEVAPDQAAQPAGKKGRGAGRKGGKGPSTWQT